jgi:hypothetical protein
MRVIFSGAGGAVQGRLACEIATDAKTFIPTRRGQRFPLRLRRCRQRGGFSFGLLQLSPEFEVDLAHLHVPEESAPTQPTPSRGIAYPPPGLRASWVVIEL